MKKQILFPLIATLCLSGVFLASCGESNDEHTLNVVALNSGYGREWLDEAKTIWEKNNPDYRIDLNATSDAKAIITSNLYKKNNTDDVYISVGSEWKRYAGGNRLASLDDLIEEEVDNMKIKDKVNDEYANSIYFKNVSGETHTYRLPWTSGIGGIMYNEALFARKGWSVPKTFDELLKLCDDIVASKTHIDEDDVTSGYVYPFCYTGANTDYFDYVTFTWWSQLTGIDNIETFKQYQKTDVDNFDTSKNETYEALKTAVSMWNKIFGNSSYYDKEDISRNNHTAQKNFMNGRAAMMINGDWVYNEMLTYSTTHSLPSGFSLAIMNTPTATDSTLENQKSAYIIGEDQYIAIPASSTKIDLAKSFIKTLLSDEVLKIFFNKAHGLMAYKLSSGNYDDSNSYMNSLLSYRSNLNKTFTNFSSSPLFLNGYVDFWGSSSGRPFESLIKGTVKDVDEAFNNIYLSVKNSWDTWVKNSNM